MGQPSANWIEGRIEALEPQVRLHKREERRHRRRAAALAEEIKALRLKLAEFGIPFTVVEQGIDTKES